MTVRELKTKDEFNEFLSQAGDKLVAVDYTATWCGPCKQIGPKFAEMSTNADFDGICFAKVDVDANSETAEEQEITAMPTFKVYKNGKKVDELVGANVEKLKDMLLKNK